ncbi:hypothetical protein CLOSTASPAR_03087 [[Clostridium] asparagiforme DSM 15981]|uniref:Uncharacterized protein n=1 Tax=[Clostridium] asparagiforme DSM 15981 TaxID=518636 RepID=C0D1E9_9FIRM|nr:hypothetical protein CLOSTASPAR_03087 [[Clostridium] asparagiforme DSM 15981]
MLFTYKYFNIAAYIQEFSPRQTVSPVVNPFKTGYNVGGITSNRKPVYGGSPS